MSKDHAKNKNAETDENKPEETTNDTSTDNLYKNKSGETLKDKVGETEIKLQETEESYTQKNSDNTEAKTDSMPISVSKDEGGTGSQPTSEELKKDNILQMQVAAVKEEERSVSCEEGNPEVAQLTMMDFHKLKILRTVDVVLVMLILTTIVNSVDMATLAGSGYNILDSNTCRKYMYPETCLENEVNYKDWIKLCFLNRCPPHENVQCVDDKIRNTTVYFCARDEDLICKAGTYEQYSIYPDVGKIQPKLLNCSSGTYRHYPEKCRRPCSERHLTDLDDKKYKVFLNGTKSAPAILQCNEENHYCPVKANEPSFEWTSAINFHDFCKLAEPGTDCLKEKKDTSRSGADDEREQSKTPSTTPATRTTIPSTRDTSTDTGHRELVEQQTESKDRNIPHSSTSIQEQRKSTDDFTSIIVLAVVAIIFIGAVTTIVIAVLHYSYKQKSDSRNERTGRDLPITINMLTPSTSSTQGENGSRQPFLQHLSESSQQYPDFVQRNDDQQTLLTRENTMEQNNNNITSQEPINFGGTETTRKEVVQATT